MSVPSNLLQASAGARVLLIGDLILDEYRQGTALGLSVETPTIVARDDASTFSLGGAGLLCRNILALDGHVKFISLVGDDQYRQYTSLFKHPNLTGVFLEDTGRKTTVKSRFWVGGYKLLGWDRLDNRFIGEDMERHIVSIIRSELPSFNKLIVSDYRHGLITESLAHSMVELAAEFEKPLYIDSQVSQRMGNHRWYTGASLFCVNRREALTIDAEFDSRPIEASLTHLQETLQSENVVVKLGERGFIALLGSRRLSERRQRLRCVIRQARATLSLLSYQLVPSHSMNPTSRSPTLGRHFPPRLTAHNPLPFPCLLNIIERLRSRRTHASVRYRYRRTSDPNPNA